MEKRRGEWIQRTSRGKCRGVQRVCRRERGVKNRLDEACSTAHNRNKRQRCQPHQAPKPFDTFALLAQHIRVVGALSAPKHAGITEASLDVNSINNSKRAVQLTCPMLTRQHEPQTFGWRYAVPHSYKMMAASRSTFARPPFRRCCIG